MSAVQSRGSGAVWRHSLAEHKTDVACLRRCLNTCSVPSSLPLLRPAAARLKLVQKFWAQLAVAWGLWLQRLYLTGRGG